MAIIPHNSSNSEWSVAEKNIAKSGLQVHLFDECGCAFKKIQGVWA